MCQISGNAEAWESLKQFFCDSRHWGNIHTCRMIGVDVFQMVEWLSSNWIEEDTKAQIASDAASWVCEWLMLRMSR